MRADARRPAELGRRVARGVGWPADTGPYPADPPPAISAAHADRLDLLIDILRCALELETPCDLAAAPGGRRVNEQIFFAHFGDWRGLLGEWNDLLVRNRAAPGRLWERVAESCRRRRVQEPPVALGNAIDKLAMLTLRRAREWQLDSQCRLRLQITSDRVGGEGRLTLQLERQRVAAAPEAALHGERALVATGEVLQAIFDEVQHSPEARAISTERDAVIALKHELLAHAGKLRPYDAAPGCPLCAGPRPPAAPAAPGALPAA